MLVLSGSARRALLLFLARRARGGGGWWRWLYFTRFRGVLTLLLAANSRRRQGSGRIWHSPSSSSGRDGRREAEGRDGADPRQVKRGQVEVDAAALTATARPYQWDEPGRAKRYVREVPRDGGRKGQVRRPEGREGRPGRACATGKRVRPRRGRQGRVGWAGSALSLPALGRVVRVRVGRGWGRGWSLSLHGREVGLKK